MTAPNDCYKIFHGKMEVTVPKNLFDRYTGRIKEAEAEKFVNDVMNRYPWISENAAKIIIKKAQEEALKSIDEKSGGVQTARNLVSQGKTDKAIERLERTLEENPEDVDAWYLYGELLCKTGRKEEGYKAINKGRSLVK